MVAGCSDDSISGVVETDAGGGLDTGRTDLGGADTAGNDATLDAPMDVRADTGPFHCGVDGDCLGKNRCWQCS